jgi:hypothetical protein
MAPTLSPSLETAGQEFTPKSVDRPPTLEEPVGDQPNFGRSKVIGNFQKAAAILSHQALYMDVSECRLAEFRQD